MQAVILAAGKSTRTYPLTLTRPKPLLKIANKAILEHNLGNLKEFIDEAIIIIGYKGDMIKKQLGNKYENIKIRYIMQKEQLGTGHALLMAKPYIKGRFALLMGDDIYSKGDIKRCLKHKYSILAAKVSNPENFGVIIEKDNVLMDFVEKPKIFVSDLVSAAFYVLDKKAFSYLGKINISERNELELPDAIKLMSKDIKIYCTLAKDWLPIVYPWDLLKAGRKLMGKKNSIGKCSKINGKVIGSAVGENCKIEGIVKGSIIMDNTTIGKNSVVEDSVIGENVFFDGKILAKNDAIVNVKGKNVNCGRIGAIISDNVTAINVELKPGCMIWPNVNVSNKKLERDVINEQ